ncbi:MAG: methyl-accepting chemotaxis protein [Desulfobacter sp.]|nr:methyl-accepting chemotaxis protein [Desulfobacter sp.]
MAKKIAGGFSIILCLLILLAFVGRTGITRVVDRVDAANHFQSLMNLILDARQNEKQFILTNEADGVSQVKKDISKLKEKIGKITRLSMDDDLAKGIKDISTGLGAYEKSFGEYVDMAHQKDILMEEMNQKANAAFEITSKIRDDQKARYDDLVAESETKISAMRQRVSFANKIIENFLQAKAYRMVISQAQSQSVSMITQWKRYHANIKQNLEEALLGSVAKNISRTKRSFRRKIYAA